MTGHFDGKSVLEHLKEARSRGAFASAEIHGVEAPGCISAGTDSSKETAFLLLLSGSPSILHLLRSLFFLQSPGFYGRQAEAPS